MYFRIFFIKGPVIIEICKPSVLFFLYYKHINKHNNEKKIKPIVLNPIRENSFEFQRQNKILKNNRFIDVSDLKCRQMWL